MREKRNEAQRWMLRANEEHHRNTETVRRGDPNKKSLHRKGKMEVEMNKCGQSVSRLSRRTASITHMLSVRKGDRPDGFV